MDELLEREEAAAEEREDRMRGRVPVPRPPARRRRGPRLDALALLISLVSLILSCVVLFLYLKPAREPESEPEPEPVEEPEVPTIVYRGHILPILEGVPLNLYEPEDFDADDNGWRTYPGARVGVDVSSYQGEIDWRKAADAGVTFAFLRAGLRGYTKGGLMEDEYFEANYKGARAAGVDVGIYFFSQAIDEREARQEAAYVVALLDGRELAYPVVFDWERISDSEARTNSLSSDEVTRCAIAFCDAIAAAGYSPAVYFNQDQGYLDYGLDRLTAYPFWLAEYHESPAFYYDFDFWQFTHRGTVPGITGAVDMDLDLRGAKAAK